jgi:phosphoglycolate phosphatase/beta-phosphoglucomutase
MTRTIQYVFWDSDNTLVDTASHHWHKHAETLLPLGIRLDPQQDGERIYTNNGAQNWAWLSAERGLLLPLEEYLNAIDTWYFAHIQDIQIRPGVTEAMDMFSQADIKQAVVSNGRRRSVMAALNAKNLTPRFAFILCKEDYVGRKPEPTPYLAAKTRMVQIVGLDIDPTSCLVIEDDPKGVQSGKSAGMTVLHRPLGTDNPADFMKACRDYLR